MIGGSVIALPHHSRDRGERGGDKYLLAILHGCKEFPILVSPNHPREKENNKQHELMLSLIKYYILCTFIVTCVSGSKEMLNNYIM